MRRERKFTGLPATKRNAEGVKVCCWCEGALSGQRKRWCSDACVNEYLATSSQAGLRKAVEKRDRGVCAGCGINAARLERIFGLLQGLSRRRVNERREEIAAGDPDAELRGYVDGQPYYGHRYVSDTHPASARRSEQLEVMVALLQFWAGQGVCTNDRWSVYCRTLWEADHIVPLAEGGAPGPENARTLCLPCHKAATRALAARLAAARRPQLSLLSV